MINYTPGPWRAIRQAFAWSLENMVGDVVFSSLLGPSSSHEEANVRLVAAAPDLYETLAREHQREYETKNGAMACQGFGEECDVCALLTHVERGSRL